MGCFEINGTGFNTRFNTHTPPSHFLPLPRSSCFFSSESFYPPSSLLPSFSPFSHVPAVHVSALQQQHDGFILHDIDGEQHLGYGVVPLFLGEVI